MYYKLRGILFVKRSFLLAKNSPIIFCECSELNKIPMVNTAGCQDKSAGADLLAAAPPHKKITSTKFQKSTF